MQVVITIDDNDYEYLKNIAELNYWELTYWERRVLRGIVLPKNHGRLFDEKNLKWVHHNAPNLEWDVFLSKLRTVVDADESSD